MLRVFRAFPEPVAPWSFSVAMSISAFDRLCSCCEVEPKTGWACVELVSEHFKFCSAEPAFAIRTTKYNYMPSVLLCCLMLGFRCHQEFGLCRGLPWQGVEGNINPYKKELKQAHPESGCRIPLHTFTSFRLAGLSTILHQADRSAGADVQSPATFLRKRPTRLRGPQTQVQISESGFQASET